MLQHVKEPTHVRGHTLDVVITRETDKIVSNLDVTDPGLIDKSGKVTRDHFAVIFNVHAAKPYPVRKKVSYRKLRVINIESFKQDIVTSSVISNSLNSTNLEELVSAYSELPVSFSWGEEYVYFCSSERYSLYVLPENNSNCIRLIFHLFTSI